MLHTDPSKYSASSLYITNRLIFIARAGGGVVVVVVVVVVNVRYKLNL